MKQISYNSYLFRKDFPIDEKTDLSPDGQRRLLGTIDNICEGQGGVFLGYNIDDVLNTNLSNAGIPLKYQSTHLVGTSYVINRILPDGSGSSPKRHSMNTSVKCVSGTEDEVLLRKLTEHYGLDDVPTVWTDQKSITD